MSSSVMVTYGRADVTFSHGEGPWLWDDQGNKYLDLLGGLAVTALGHAHPDIVKAVSEQAAKLVHTSNLYHIKPQQDLAEKLTRLSGMENVFFCNSGAEANETALKIARAHGNSKGIASPEVIVADGSFHGRTMATLSATGNPKVHAGFAPLVSGYVHVPYDDADAVQRTVSERPNVVAVLVEPILGEGGVVLPGDSYLQNLRAICDEHGLLLMLDEVQTGMGRTGRWFAHQHAGITPDVMTLAKALGNGVPIGACVARGEAAQTLRPGMHGSTYGGNFLSCSAANAVIDTIERDGLVDAAGKGGDKLMAALADELAGLNCVKEIRGKGMMLAVVLDRDCGELVAAAMADGILLNVTAGNVVRMLPPYILDDDQIADAAKRVARLIRAWNAGQPNQA